MPNLNFGARVFSLLVAKGWNMRDLANQTGLHRDAISTYMRGTALPTPLEVQAIAKAFGVPKEEIMPNSTEGDGGPVDGE